MLQFQQSETTAERRRWIIVLVDSADGVTGLTGQTGTVKISKNGGAASDSTNSIVEVDAGDMPGHYYIELTAAELDTLGHISITKKTAGSLAFHDRAIVSYNDPYVSTGGFSSGGSSSGFRLTDKHIEMIAKKVWEYQVQEDVTAKDKLIAAADHPITDLSSIEAKFADIVIPELDLSSVIEAVESIQIPVPVDYSKALSDLSKAVDGFKSVNMDGLNDAIAHFNTKMDVAAKEISSSMETVGDIKLGFQTLKELMDEFSAKTSEMSDMDKRFENMTSVMQKQELTALVNQINETAKKILIDMVNMKHDILEQLNQSEQ